MMSATLAMYGGPKRQNNNLKKKIRKCINALAG